MTYRNSQDLPDADRWRTLSYQQALGKSTVVPFVFSAGQNVPSPLSCLQIHGNDEEAHQLCLTLGPPGMLPGGGSGVQPLNNDAQTLNGFRLNDNPDQDVTIANPYAEIEWGVGGVSFKAQCDILNGLCVNLTASFLRVRMAVDEVGGDTGAAYYQISGFVGPGVAKFNSAQRSYQHLSFSSHLSPIRPIPPFARSISLVSRGNFLPLTRLAAMFYRSRTSGVFDATYEFDTKNPGPHPIPNGCLYYAVYSDPTDAVQAIFDLAI